MTPQQAVSVGCKLQADRLHGQLCGPSELIDAASTLAENTHLVSGIVDAWPDGLDHLQLPNGASVDVLLRSPVSGSSPIRVTVVDKSNNTKVVCLHRKTVGTPKLLLKAAVIDIAPPKSVTTCVLRIQLFKDHCCAHEWTKIMASPQTQLRDALFALDVQRKAVIDMFGFKQADGCVHANIRILEDQSSEFLKLSGKNKLLIKPLTGVGGVEWVRRHLDEPGGDYLARARELAAGQGLAFSCTGSLGLGKPKAGFAPPG